MSCTHCRLIIDVSVYTLEYRRRSAAEQISHHSPGLGLCSIVSRDKPFNAIYYVEAGKVIRRKSLALNAIVGIIGEEIP